MIAQSDGPRADTEYEQQTNIFVIHGEAPVRDRIESIATAAGFPVRCSATVVDFLSTFTPSAASCVVLDPTLPDANGLELEAVLANVGAAVVFVTPERCITSSVRGGVVHPVSAPCIDSELRRMIALAATEASRSWLRSVEAGRLRTRYEQLTHREREVFSLVSVGLLNKQVAYRLNISEITVQIHRGRVMRKLGARSFASLVRMADLLQPVTT